MFGEELKNCYDNTRSGDEFWGEEQGATHMPTTLERRRSRRAALVDIPVTIRAIHNAEKVSAGHVKDISLSGLYCYVKAPCALTPGEAVTCSLSIPPEQTRAFPFARVLGKGWILRIEPVTTGRREGEVRPGAEPVVGVAVTFAQDVTALASI